MKKLSVLESDKAVAGMRWTALGITLFGTSLVVLFLAKPRIFFDSAENMNWVQLYTLGFVGVLWGSVVFGAARASRLPRSLKIFGALMVLDGSMAPVIGVEGFQGIFDSLFSAEGVLFARVFLSFVLIFYLFIMYALTPPRGETAVAS